jgi:uncharacterized protein
MGERTSYRPGTFSWVDLATTDPDGAKTFYRQVFGWEAEDAAVEGGGTYTMLRLGGRDAGALFGQGEEERGRGIPPHWNSYVTVEDVGEVAERARSLGGNVLAEPFDVMEAGRMAVIADPTGAVLCLWQPRDNIGARVVNEHGALTWNDLYTSDIDAAGEFYRELFDWELERLEGHDVPYTIIRNDGTTNGGIAPLMEHHGGAPPHWLPYFAVESVERTLAEAEEAGGRKLAGPIDVPAGRIGIAQDPQGATFALFEGELDD